MKDEYQKSLHSSSVAFGAKGSKLNDKRPLCGKQAKKVARALQNSRPKNGIAEKKKAMYNAEKNIASVKCYNYGKKGHFASLGIVPSSLRYLLPLKLLKYMCVPIHLLLTLLLNGL